MTKIDLTYDIVNYTPASASPVDSNFDRVEQHINQELIERDGTVAMRAQLMLVGDPVNALDAAPKQYVDQVLPVGIIMMYGGMSAPPGGRWAMCNGAELQTSQEPDLFNIIGHNFSPEGTPGSRFYLPNLGDRMPIGVGLATTIGKTGGQRNSILVKHTHTMKHHTHSIDHDHPNSTTVSAGGHRHTFPLSGAEAALVPDFSGNQRFGDGTEHVGGSTMGLAGDHTHAVNIVPADKDSGGPNDNITSEMGVDAVDMNLPPYLGVQYIIRIR